MKDRERNINMLKIKEIISVKIAEQILAINSEAEITAAEISSMLEYPLM